MTKPRRSAWVLAILFLILGMMSSVVAGNIRAMNEAGGRAILSEMVYSQAERPFVARPLVPQMIRAIEIVVPDLLETKIASALRSKQADEVSLQPGHRSMNSESVGFEHLYFYLTVVNGLLLAVFGWCLAAVVSELFGERRSIGVWVASAALGALPFFSPFVSYFPYDQGTLALTGLALYGLTFRQSWVYFLALGLFPFNKETAVFLPMLYLAFRAKEMPSARLGLTVVAQLVYCFGMKIGIDQVFAGNEGSTVIFKLWENLDVLFSGAKQSAIVVYLFFGLLIFLHLKVWKLLPEVVRRSMLIVYPLAIVMDLLLGVIQEFRAILEVYPLIVMAFLPFVKWVSEDLDTKS